MSIKDISTYDLLLACGTDCLTNKADTELWNYISKQLGIFKLELKNRDDIINFINDQNDDVRYAVALNINQDFIHLMINDSNKLIRRIAACNIKVSYLPQMMNDESAWVRHYVAKRIDKENAVLMWATDKAEWIRDTARNNVMAG